MIGTTRSILKKMVLSARRCEVLNVREYIPVRTEGVFKLPVVSAWKLLINLLYDHSKRHHPGT